MEMNWSLLVSYALAILVEVGLPVTLALLITKKWKVRWVVILTGVLTFIGSQVVHLPILAIPAGLQKLGLNVTLPQNWPIVYYAIYLGLLAGLCEETARWVGFKILKSKAASYKSGFGLGIGHGGIESVLTGLIVLANVATFLFVSPETLRASGTPDATVQLYVTQIAAFWATPWHLPFAGAVERITAISAQILMSVMVWKAVMQRSWLWYLLAVVYHALIDAVAVYLGMSTSLTAWQLEAVLLVFLVIDVVFLFLFWKKEKGLEESTDNAAADPPLLPTS